MSAVFICDEAFAVCLTNLWDFLYYRASRLTYLKLSLSYPQTAGWTLNDPNPDVSWVTLANADPRFWQAVTDGLWSPVAGRRLNAGFHSCYRSCSFCQLCSLSSPLSLLAVSRLTQRRVRHLSFFWMTETFQCAKCCPRQSRLLLLCPLVHPNSTALEFQVQRQFQLSLIPRLLISTSGDGDFICDCKWRWMEIHLAVQLWLPAVWTLFHLIVLHCWDLLAAFLRFDRRGIICWDVDSDQQDSDAKWLYSRCLSCCHFREWSYSSRHSRKIEFHPVTCLFPLWRILLSHETEAGAKISGALMGAEGCRAERVEMMSVWWDSGQLRMKEGSNA